MKDVTGWNAGLLLDYNGVIVDDESVHESAFCETLAKFGLDLTPELYRRCCLGRTDADGFRELAASLGGMLEQKSIPELVELKGYHYRQLVAGAEIFYPGIMQTLKDLSQHFALAIVTSSQRVDVLAAIEGTIIPKLIAFVLAAEDVKRGKPDPEGYLLGATRLGFPREHIVVVEDSASGVSAAVAAGLRCIAVKHTTDASLLSKAHMIIEKTTDITPDLVKRILVEVVDHD